MGGRVEPERRLEEQQFTKLGLLYLQSINSVTNTCNKVPLQETFFRWRHFALESIGSYWPVKPLVKRPGGLHMWGLGFRGPVKEHRNVWRSLCSRVGSSPTQTMPPSPPPSRGGGGGMVRADPSHSLSGTHCPTHPPWGVGIRLVRKGLSRQPQVHDLRCGVDLLSDFALFFFARGTPVSDGIPKWWHY